ncbi:MAG TPA: hypothetical protein ENI64_02865 [Gammaproteobacteria bacterium]|nr:hypothetical protein [Gammaproteobacteria bacterium]
MTRIRTYLSIACLFATATYVNNTVAADYTVTFKTTECNGDRGMASVKMDTIWRMSSIECRSPQNPDEKLMQLLVKSTSGLTTYDVFRITPSEADRIQQQIDRYMDAKTHSLENSDQHNINIDRHNGH